jgi:hypothetical protein
MNGTAAILRNGIFTIHGSLCRMEKSTRGMGFRVKEIADPPQTQKGPR